MERARKSAWFLIGLLLLCGVAFLDYITGSELSFSLFYLIPIAVFSLVFSGTAGVAVAFVSAGVWLMIEVMTANGSSSSFIYLWNTIIRLGFFLLPALLLRAFEQERSHARTDYLTGAINNRYFNEIMQMEIDRSIRYKRPFTIAFIDIDNFKTINDTFGHTFGDSLLRSIAENMKKHLRKTDYVARVGGDEFVLLLPETDTTAARLAISNLFQKLAEEMRGRNWPVTYSVGVLTLNAPPLSTDNILREVDKMMYSVKNNGKDSIKYEVYLDE